MTNILGTQYSVRVDLDPDLYLTIASQLQVRPYMTIDQAIECLCRQAIQEYAEACSEHGEGN